MSLNGDTKPSGPHPFDMGGGSGVPDRDCVRCGLPDRHPVHNTPGGCPACAERRLHTAAEWRLHPLKGHGYAPECGGWTHESLKGAK